MHREIDLLINVIENNLWKNQMELTLIRSDADCIHSDGFYFFNISVHRAMILIEFDCEEATVVWVGSHQEYERVFKGNKNTIRSWLRANDWIQ